MTEERKLSYNGSIILRPEGSMSSQDAIRKIRAPKFKAIIGPVNGKEILGRLLVISIPNETFLLITVQCVANLLDREEGLVADLALIPCTVAFFE